MEQTQECQSDVLAMHKLIMKLVKPLIEDNPIMPQLIGLNKRMAAQQQEDRSSLKELWSQVSNLHNSQESFKFNQQDFPPIKKVSPGQKSGASRQTYKFVA